jgi:ubiquinone/menaquinone biosynthesis C-methylase UbiE
MRDSRRRTAELVQKSYDQHAGTYDVAWTSHMRPVTQQMLDRLEVQRGESAIDLTCGTGFVTDQLTQRTGRPAIGVDASAAMLEVARRTHVSSTFVQADVVAHLRTLADESIDVATCAWGLGYSQPTIVMREIRRVLRRGGRVAIIDNSLFSLAEVMWASLRTFAERPEAMAHAMNVRFLPNSFFLAILMRRFGVRVLHRADGRHTYFVANGHEAIERLMATGAAAGFEFAAEDAHREEIFARFAELLDERRTAQGVAVTHRWLAAIGRRRG